MLSRINNINLDSYGRKVTLYQWNDHFFSLREFDYAFDSNCVYFVQSIQDTNIFSVKQIANNRFYTQHLFHDIISENDSFYLYKIPFPAFKEITIRRSIKRGFHERPLFKSNRLFSFADHTDPRYMNWGPIRTWNDDTSEPGFETQWHEHKQLDILSYVLKGQVYHKDDIGNELVAYPGQIQHMWCGDSIWHSEANNGTESNHYMQIWFMYEKDPEDMKPKYTLIQRPPTFSNINIPFVNPDITFSSGIMTEDVLVHPPSFLFIVEGNCILDDTILSYGDSVEIYKECTIKHMNAHIVLIHTTNVNSLRFKFPAPSAMKPHPNPLK